MEDAGDKMHDSAARRRAPSDPPFECYTAWLPTLEAALRRQAIQQLGSEYRQQPAHSALASIMMKCAILLQVICTEIVPNQLLNDLSQSIVVAGMQSDENRHLMFRCANRLRLAYPTHPALAKEKLVILDTDRNKKRHTNR